MIYVPVNMICIVQPIWGGVTQGYQLTTYNIFSGLTYNLQQFFRGNLQLTTYFSQLTTF